MFAVVARIATAFADRGIDAEDCRILCRSFGAKPRIHKRRQPHGSGLDERCCPIERTNAWLLENERPALRCDQLGFIVKSLLQSACPFLVAGKPAQEFRKPPLNQYSAAYCCVPGTLSR
jgi:transposase